MPWHLWIWFFFFCYWTEYNPLYLKAQIEMYSTPCIYVPICTVISEINSSNEGSSIFECVLDTPFFNEGFFFNFNLCGPVLITWRVEKVIHPNLLFCFEIFRTFFGCTYNIGRMVAVGHLLQTDKKSITLYSQSKSLLKTMRAK